MSTGIKQARDFAIKTHGDQLYGGLVPYVYHLDGVAMNINKLFGPKTVLDNLFDRTLKVGYLHDTIEDSSNSQETAKSIEEVFGPKIYYDVLALTRSKDISYYDYINTFKGHSRIITIVKLADLKFNISHSEEGSRKDKYRFAYEKLKEYNFEKQWFTEQSY